MKVSSLSFGITDAQLNTLTPSVARKMNYLCGKSEMGTSGLCINSCVLIQSGDPADVIELTDANFEKLVLGSEDMWLVEFYAPWCGHCKNLAPHWASAASELKGQVKLGALDATVHTVIAGKYGVSIPYVKPVWV